MTRGGLQYEVTYESQVAGNGRTEIVKNNFQLPAKKGLFRSINYFVVVFCAGWFSHAVLYAYFVAVTTTMMRQFGWNYASVGFLVSCYDIGNVALILLTSHIASHFHIPRTIAVCTFLSGLGVLIFAIPQLLYYEPSPYVNNNPQPGTDSNGVPIILCDSLAQMAQQYAAMNMTPPETGTKDCEAALNRNSKAFNLMVAAMIINAFFYSPVLPLGLAYTDNNAPAGQSAWYIGIIYSLAGWGPIAGFALGIACLHGYVDLNISPDHLNGFEDFRWVGCWWIGFLIIGGLHVIVSPLIWFAPKSLRGNPDIEKASGCMKMKASGCMSNVCRRTKEFFKIIWKLLVNPIYMLLVVASIFEFYVASGLFILLPKYFESYFRMNTWEAVAATAVATALSVALGTMTGGALVSKLKWKPVQIIKCIIATQIVAIGCLTGLPFITCNQEDGQMHGLTNLIPQMNTLECSPTCLCTPEYFYPVCGSNGINYASSCVAGCTHFDFKTEVFSNCSCLPTGTTATIGNCPHKCTNTLVAYTAVCFLLGFFTTLALPQGLTVMLRSISKDKKPIAMALSTLAYSAFSFILGPNIYGKLVDDTCNVWPEACALKSLGLCLEYDFDAFRFKMHFVTLGCKVVAFFLYLIVLWRAKTWIFTDYEPDESPKCTATCARGDHVEAEL